jgi:hemolysin activation/secretion protein
MLMKTTIRAVHSAPPPLRRIGAIFAVAGLLPALVAVGVPFARAQTASQVTPETFAPPQQRLQGALVFSGEPGLAAPPGAEELSITLRDVAVEGTLPGLEAETAALRQRLTRGVIPASELFEAAAELEQAYVNSGYPLARVVLPAQELRDGGVLRLAVVDGFVERIDYSAVPEEVRARLQVLTEPLVGQRGLTLSELERRILLAGDTYGVALGSALQAGATPGGTVIILDPQYRGVTGFVGADNSLSDSLGDWKIDAGVELNGLLGYGESIYFRIGAHPDAEVIDDPTLRTISLGTVVPIGREGLTFNLEGAFSQTNSEGSGPDVPSDFQRYSARLFYPWVRSRSFNLTTQLSFDVQDDRLDVDTPAGELPVYEDAVRVLRGSADAFWLLGGGAAVELGAQLSFGLDAFGARTADDAAGDTPLSRPGADADFAKLEVSARYRQSFGETLLATVNGRAQTSFGDPLILSEQFGVASSREISPLDAGTVTGDGGWVVRGELARPFDLDGGPLGWTVSPFAFAAAGAVFREQPVDGEADDTFANAYGVGVDVFYPFEDRFSNASLRLELGRATRDDDQDDGTKFSVQGSYRF